MMQKSPVRIIGFTGFILTLSYLFYFLREADLSLIYYWHQTIPLSFGESLQTPGGFSGLLGDRLLEIMILPFRGSMGVVLLVAMVFFSLHLLYRKFQDNPLYFPFLLAALIPFILLFAHYRVPTGLILGVTTGFVLSVLQGLFSPRNLVVGSIYHFITGLFVYQIAGTVGLLVLLQAIIIRIILSKRYLKLISILPLLIVPVFYFLFNLEYTIKDAYLGSLITEKNNEIPLILYFGIISPVLLLMGLSGLRFLCSRFSLKWPTLLSGTSIAMVLLALVISSRASINEVEKSILATVQASSEKEWEKVLELNNEQLYINKVVQFEINRALYHQGELLDKLFYFPQRYGVNGIFLEENAYSSVAVHMCEFYSDLGFANETRHWATEAHIGYMRHPIVLKHLINSYLAIGNNKAALKYLSVLSGSKLYKEWCDLVYEMIENNTIGEDPTIQSFIRNNPTRDFFATTKRPTEKLSKFYRNNMTNKMAFEFLVASYLLQHEVGKVMGKLAEFRIFGYEMLPRAVEEAIMIYMTKTTGGERLMAGYSLHPEIYEEFKDFSTLVLKGESRAEKMKYASKYKNTYWYYILFTSPYLSQN